MSKCQKDKEAKLKEVPMIKTGTKWTKIVKIVLDSNPKYNYLWVHTDVNENK